MTIIIDRLILPYFLQISKYKRKYFLYNIFYQIYSFVMPEKKRKNAIALSSFWKISIDY